MKYLKLQQAQVKSGRKEELTDTGHRSIEPGETKVGFNRSFRRFVMSLLPVALIAVALAGCSLETLTKPTQYSPQQQNAASEPNPAVNTANYAATDSLPGESLIKPGDQIQITVWGYPEFNTTTTVKDYGTITVPLVGEVIAAGMTEHQLSEELKQRLSEYVKGDVRLTISHIGMDKRVSVMGAVTRQGNYPALNDLSLIEVIAEAGGTTPTADLRHIRIYRGGVYRDVLDVDLTKYLRNGNVRSIPDIYPGDTVFVPEQQNFVQSFANYASEIVLMFGFFTLIR